VNKVIDLIEESLNDLNNAKDTVWITGSETVFERLTQIYILAGGDRKKLEELYPDYF